MATVVVCFLVCAGYGGRGVNTEAGAAAADRCRCCCCCWDLIFDVEDRGERGMAEIFFKSWVGKRGGREGRRKRERERERACIVEAVCAGGGIGVLKSVLEMEGGADVWDILVFDRWWLVVRGSGNGGGGGYFSLSAL